MAGTIGSAYVQIKPTTKGIKNELEQQLNQNAQSAGTSAGRATGKHFSSALTGAVAGVAASLTSSVTSKITAGLGNITKSVDALAGYDYSMKFLKIDEKSVQKNKAMLKEYSLSTMYSMNDVLNVSKVVAAGGAKNYGELTKSLGNVVAMANGTGEEFKSMANVMGKVQTAGKLTGETWASITNTIPEMSANLKKALKENGAYTGDFSKALSKGEISAKEFNEALLKVDKDSKGMGESFAKGSSFFSGSLNAISKSVERVGIEIVDSIGQTNLTKIFNSISDGISAVGRVFVSSVKFIQANIGWIKPLTIGLIGLAAAIKGLLIIKSVASTVSGLAKSFKGLGAITKMGGAAGGAASGGALAGLATGLKAMANPQVVIGAAALGVVMVILSGAAWASIKIISNALPDLSKALTSFSTVDGSNLAKVGLGMVGLGAGMAALVGGSWINKLASFVGLDFGNTLKDIVTNINESMKEINPESLKQFAELGTALANLGASFGNIKGIENMGIVADSIKSINTTVSQMMASGTGVEQYTVLAGGLKTLTNALTGFASINGENLVQVGDGLVKLGLGISALTAGGVLDKLGSLVGADFGAVLRSIVEPIAELMPKLTPESLAGFAQLGNALSQLGLGYEKIKGFTNGFQIASSISQIDRAVQTANETGMDAYSGLSAKFAELGNAVTKLNSVKVNSTGLATQLTETANKIKTLNNFNWSGAALEMSNRAKGIGQAIGQGIAAGITSSQAQALATIGTTMDALVAEAKRRAKIHSPSRVFRDKVGYWIGAGLGVGIPRGVKDHTPDTISMLQNSLSGHDVRSSNVVGMPSTFNVVDEGGLVMRLKPVIDEKITRNNINKKIVI